MNKRERDIIAAPRERTTSHETESCKRCSTPLHFATDGMGTLVPQCPHCHWGWPAPRAKPQAVTCEHGRLQEDQCTRCAKKRAARVIEERYCEVAAERCRQEVLAFGGVA